MFVIRFLAHPSHESKPNSPAARVCSAASVFGFFMRRTDSSISTNLTRERGTLLATKVTEESDQRMKPASDSLRG